MKRIIALWGTSNRGKSAIINKVYKKVKTKYPEAIINEIVIGIDIKVVIEIDNKKVGIESQGDPSSRLPDSIKYFVEIGCDVIICATRTRGMTVDAVNAQKGRYEISWLKQDYIAKNSEFDSYNNKQVNTIMKLLVDSID